MTTREPDFLDTNGREVAAFASYASNVGFARFTDLIVAMFKSGAWRRFQDGLGTYEFLSGEFDYFLTQQGVSRSDVMNGVRDIETKAQLEAAMDERRTGEEGYRRRITDVRRTNPERPGRPIEPFGYQESEAKYLVGGTRASRAGKREALGSSVRRWVNTGGATTRRPSEARTPLDRARLAMRRLNDADLETLFASLKKERQRRHRVARDHRTDL